MLDRLYGALRGIDVSEDQRKVTQPPAAVIAAIEDDLNTPESTGGNVQTLHANLTRQSILRQSRELAAQLLVAGELVGLLQQDAEQWFAGDSAGELTAEQIEALISERNQARASRDFAAADTIRDKLADSGCRN